MARGGKHPRSTAAGVGDGSRAVHALPYHCGESEASVDDGDCIAMGNLLIGFPCTHVGWFGENDGTLPSKTKEYSTDSLEYSAIQHTRPLRRLFKGAPPNCLPSFSDMYPL